MIAEADEECRKLQRKTFDPLGRFPEAVRLQTSLLWCTCSVGAKKTSLILNRPLDLEYYVPSVDKQQQSYLRRLGSSYRIPAGPTRYERQWFWKEDGPRPINLPQPNRKEQKSSHVGSAESGHAIDEEDDSYLWVCVTKRSEKGPCASSRSSCESDLNSVNSRKYGLVGYANNHETTQCRHISNPEKFLSSVIASMKQNLVLKRILEVPFS